MLYYFLFNTLKYFNTFYRIKSIEDNQLYKELKEEILENIDKFSILMATQYSLDIFSNIVIFCILI